MLWGFHCSKINTLGTWVAGVWCSCGSTMATPIGTSPGWILSVPGLSLGPRLSLASRGWTLGVPKSVLGDPGWVHPILFCPPICVQALAPSRLCLSVVLKQSCQLGTGGEAKWSQNLGCWCENSGWELTPLPASQTGEQDPEVVLRATGQASFSLVRPGALGWHAW